MIKQKKKICAHCQEEKYIFKNISGLKYCKECSFSQKEKGQPIKKSSIAKKFPKATGEKILFFEIFNERDPWCELCGEPILEFNVANYHHLKHKGNHPELRLDKTNIIKVCFNCHRKFHS